MVGPERGEPDRSQRRQRPRARRRHQVEQNLVLDRVEHGLSPNNRHTRENQANDRHDESRPSDSEKRNAVLLIGAVSTHQHRERRPGVAAAGDVRLVDERPIAPVLAPHRQRVVVVYARRVGGRPLAAVDGGWPIHPTEVGHLLIRSTDPILVW